MHSPRTSPQVQPLRFAIAFALPLGRGVAYLGFTDQHAAAFSVFNLLFDDGGETRLGLTGGEAILIRTSPPGLHSTPASHTPGQGFVIWVPARALQGKQPLITLNDQLTAVEKVPLVEPAHIFTHPDLLAAYGHALLSLATTQGDKRLLGALTAPLVGLARERSGELLGCVEQSWRIASWLLVIGRINCEPGVITTLRLKAGRSQALDVSNQVQRIPLPRVDAQGNLLRSGATGFFLLLADTLLPRGSKPSLLVDTQASGTFVFPLHAQPAHVDALAGIVSQHPALATPLLQALRGATIRSNDERLALANAARACFDAQWSRARATCRYENICAAGINAAYALDESGLLVHGSLAKPDSLPLQAWLHAPDQVPLNVSQRIVRLPLEGDLERVRAILPQAGAYLTFVLHVPLQSAGGARRLLRVVLPDMADLWLRIETPLLRERGLPLAREMLAKLPPSDFLWRNFKRVFDQGLGAALQWAGRTAAARSTPEVHEFGTPPRKPTVSVVVPLYGRCDFLRHQLAQFCDDADFTNVDLIYVVDDPTLHLATLQLAGRYQPLFGVPLRVVTYAENRGYAGANNTAVALARSPLVLLLNSDVLPQHAGWLTMLVKALQRLPGCGMVGPLLQYPEGSVQHAGMAATRQLGNPGLVFSYHPGKGCAWDGGDKASEHPMLTGACLLLRKRDYLAVGGLDENYLVGDFEDSDFSLKLRALGKRLYLVPAARLWHLERQSQYLGTNVRTVRDMLTMYNAWRYQSKIAAGLLPDPETLQVSS